MHEFVLKKRAIRHSYLPHMLMSKTSTTIPTAMQTTTSMDISMLSHVIHSCVMLSTNGTDVSLLTSFPERS